MAFSDREMAASWRERGLERTLREARSRSVARMERFVAAARDLANATGSAGFTVQQVVERAGLSLKSFYSCFRGKDDLLLALLEEDTRLGAQALMPMLDAHREPVARLRAFVDGIFALVSLPDALGYARVLVDEHRRLSESHPDELRAAIAPLVGLLAAELAAAARVGAARVADPDRDAAMVFSLVIAAIHDLVRAPARSEPRTHAEHVWKFCWHGLAPRDA